LPSVSRQPLMIRATGPIFYSFSAAVKKLFRLEEPAVNSHARQGVVCGTDEFEGRRPGTNLCRTFGARS
jgi:hypothetical protein